MTDSPNDPRLVAQLRSEKGRKAALTAMCRRPPSALTDEVAALLRDLLERDDAASDRDAVIEAILVHPTESLRDIYEQLAYLEPPFRRARVLELLPMWSDRVPLGDTVPRILAAAMTSDLPWLRFVAAVQAARLGVDDGEAWLRAARAIIASRIPEPMRCIRPQAEEMLEPSEIVLVNAELRALGAPELPAR